MEEIKLLNFTLVLFTGTSLNISTRNLLTKTLLFLLGIQKLEISKFKSSELKLLFIVVNQLHKL